MSTVYILSGIAVMAFTTYLIRVLPMVIFRKKITDVWVKSFLYYVPYTVLAAMTFPAVLSSTGSVVSSVLATAAALVLAYCNRSLLTVALVSSAVALIVKLIGF